MTIPRDRLTALASEFVELARKKAIVRYRNLFGPLPEQDKVERKARLTGVRLALSRKVEAAPHGPDRSIELQLADVEAQLEALETA